MASREGGDFNAACFRGRTRVQMSVGMNLGYKSAAAPNSQPVSRSGEGVEGGGLVVRKLERRGLWNFDLNVAPPEAAECEVVAEEGGGNGSETLPLPGAAADVANDDSAKKADSSDERELNFNVETRAAEIGAGVEPKEEEVKVQDSRWAALLGVAENALREKKEEEIRKRRRGESQEAELGAEATAATARKRIGGQRRQSLVEDWTGAEAVVVRSTRGRAVAMPSKYKDSVLGAVAVAAAELPRHSKNGKSATTVFCTKRKSR